MKLNLRLCLVTLLSALAIHNLSARTLQSINDSLLKVLDDRVAHRAIYEAEKLNAMRKLRVAYSNSCTPERRFAAVADLFNQYKSFAMDTTMMLANEAYAISRQVPANDTLRWQAMLMLSEAEKGYGNYPRALALLDSLPREAHGAFRIQIISRYCSVYYSLAELEDNPLSLRQKLIAYRDTLASEAATADARLLNLLEALKQRQDISRALDLYVNYADSIAARGLEEDDAILYVGGELHLMNGDTLQAINQMTRVAIHDMEKGVRKYTSLPVIANVLYEMGDYDRAYKYIITSLDDVRRSKAQSRMAKVLEYLPIISQGYEKQLEVKQQQRQTYTITAAILGLLILLAASALFIQHKRLKAEHRSISESHLQLSRLKKNLDELNSQLLTANHNKEESILSLFNLCHEYVSMMNTHNSTLMRLVKGGASISQVAKCINTLPVSAEMGNFFAKFDETILAIFPNFIEGFNALMQPQFRTDPDAKCLTPELRIYALVRLGMNDSTKIATLLHYSPQTVYNYRFRARQHSIFAKEEFLESVRNL